MRFISNLKTLAQQETPAGRRQRMVPAAMYGLIIASTFALVGSVVNQVSFPDLPVRVDWRNIFTSWLSLAAWLSLGGAFINWFTQTEESMITGLLAMTVTALGAGALTLEGSLPTQFGKTILLVMPLIAISLLMTITLRWFGVHHAEALEKEQVLKRRRIATLTAIAVTIGLVTGFGLHRWSLDTLRAVQHIHGRLQTAAMDPSRVASIFPLNDVPGLEAHSGQPYTIYAHPSGQSVVAVETTINYNDGYQITCVLLVFPDISPFLQACAEGRKVILQNNQ